MSRLIAMAGVVDAVNDVLGRGVAWLTLVMVLMQFAVVVMRYVFGLSSIYMQESIVYMHAIVFLAAAGYTLLHEGHVRVDIFYGSADERRRAWTNLLGVLLLLWPMAATTLLASWGYVLASWKVFEVSPEGAGLPAIFLLKTFIWVFASVLILQGFSLAAHSLGVILGIEQSSTPQAEEEHAL
ncbi:MAG: TRAP transporter small permease subunit [Alphaproteobacteria bacterium]|nr:TRAP transporter small permease subunit [Alphaproteobacteria bacterium]MDP6623980.1 TRAP transporter small permease subunit [Alphaproteobacteria bacterium]